ncbi:MAG: hypothetical protein Pars2KO_11230 [Parasphingorhabdus sp.]
MPSVQSAAMSVDPNRAGAASGITAFIQMMMAGLATQIVGSLQDDTMWPLASSLLIGSIGTLLLSLKSYKMTVLYSDDGGQQATRFQLQQK